MFFRQENELQAWRTITEIQRERIVVEISDLVHRQLVSTALESDFRHHLERNVLVRSSGFFFRKNSSLLYGQNRLAHGAPVQQDPPAVVARPVPPPQPARPTTDAVSFFNPNHSFHFLINEIVGCKHHGLNNTFGFDATNASTDVYDAN